MMIYDSVSEIDIHEVTKTYHGRKVLDNITVTVDQGEVVGLIGPNGCGKTTVLRIAAGLVQPTAGKVTVAGRFLSDAPGAVPPGLGVLFDPPGLLPYLSGLDNLKMLASLRRVIDVAAVRDWMRRVGLNPGDRKPVRAYSQGMVQRLGLAQALMEAPRVVLLDEPTNALDPEGVELVARLIRRQQERGAAVLLASHYLEEVVRVCTRVLKLVDGHAVPAAAHDFDRHPAPVDK